MNLGKGTKILISLILLFFCGTGLGVLVELALTVDAPPPGSRFLLFVCIAFLAAFVVFVLNVLWRNPKPKEWTERPRETPLSDGFEVHDGVLIRYTGPGGTVVVPEGVTEIGKRAFEGLSTVTDVVLPQSLRTIGDYAFLNCRFLQYPAIPDGVAVGKQAFTGTANPPTTKTAPKTTPERASTPSYLYPELPERVTWAYIQSGKPVDGMRLQDERTVMEVTYTAHASRYIHFDVRNRYSTGTLNGTWYLHRTGEEVYASWPPDTPVPVDEYYALPSGFLRKSKKILRRDLIAAARRISDQLDAACERQEGARFVFPDGVVEIAAAQPEPAEPQRMNPPAVQPEPEAPPEPPPLDGFEVRDGVLIRYTGPGGTVMVPDGVTEIGKRAFEGCSTVTDVVFPQSLRTIGDYAFLNCRFLQYPAIPERVTIGKRAFLGTANPPTVGSTPKPQAPAELQRKKTPAAQPKPKAQEPVKRDRTERTLENVFEGTRVLFRTAAKEERGERANELLICSKTIVIDEDDGTLLLVTKRGRPDKLQVTAFEEITYARMHALLEARGIEALQERFRDLSLTNFRSVVDQLPFPSNSLCLAESVIGHGDFYARSRRTMPSKMPSGLDSFSMQLVDYGFQKAIEIDAWYYDKRPIDFGDVIWLPENFFEDKTPAQAARDVEQMVGKPLYQEAVQVRPLMRFFEEEMERMKKAPASQKQQASVKQEKSERKLLDVYTGARLLFLTEAREEGNWSRGETVHTVKRLVIDERDGTLLLVTERGKPNKLRVTAFEEISYARLPALLESRGVETLQRKFAGLTPSHYTEYLPELERAYENASLCISPALPCVGEQKIPCSCKLDDFELWLFDYGVQKSLYYSGTWDSGLAAAYGPSRPIRESGELWLPENYFETKTTQEAAKDLAAMLICENTMADVPYEAIQAALEGTKV